MSIAEIQKEIERMADGERRALEVLSYTPRLCAECYTVHSYRDGCPIQLRAGERDISKDRLMRCPYGCAVFIRTDGSDDHERDYHPARYEWKEKNRLASSPHQP